MFQEPEIELTGLQRLAGELTADRDFKPSRQKVLNALASLLDATELHRAKSIGRILSTTRGPGGLLELEEALLPFVSDPGPEPTQSNAFVETQNSKSIGSFSSFYLDKQAKEAML